MSTGLKNKTKTDRLDRLAYRNVIFYENHNVFYGFQPIRRVPLVTDQKYNKLATNLCTNIWMQNLYTGYSFTSVLVFKCEQQLHLNVPPLRTGQVSILHQLDNRFQNQNLGPQLPCISGIISDYRTVKDFRLKTRLKTRGCRHRGYMTCYAILKGHVPCS